MTKEFAKKVSKLAKAHNFDDGAYLLITAHTGNGIINIERKGLNHNLIKGIICALEGYLKQLNNIDRISLCEAIKSIIVKDEQSRFQNKSIGGYDD